MRRGLVMATAGVIAVASALGLFAYVSRADERATQGADLVPVLIAATDLPAGQTFSQAWDAGLVVPSETLRRLRPPSAVLDASSLGGTVATHDIAAGEVIVAPMFAAPDDVAKVGPPTFAQHIPAGMVGVSFSATAAQAVGELVQPGDLVNLLVQVPDAAEVGLAPTNGPAIVHVFQDLKVIAIGKAVADPNAATAAENPGTGIYTVAVDAKDSARLLYLSQQYPVFLTLVGPDTDAVPVPPVAGGNALPDSLTPPAVSQAGAP